jgi:hypothetical protein
VEHYDPSQAPSAAEWLSLDEAERIYLVERDHHDEAVGLQNPRLHATIHVMEENQLALDD